MSSNLRITRWSSTEEVVNAVRAYKKSVGLGTVRLVSTFLANVQYPVSRTTQMPPTNSGETHSRCSIVWETTGRTLIVIRTRERKFRHRKSI